MADKIYLETTELENIASGLKTKGNSIKEEYTTNCYSALKMGNSCLEVTGLDTDKFFGSLNTIYTNISDRCNSLANFITNNVIPNYDQVSKVITDNFDNELGKELAAIMGLTATTNNSSSSSSSSGSSSGSSSSSSSNSNSKTTTESGTGSTPPSNSRTTTPPSNSRTTTPPTGSRTTTPPSGSRTTTPSSSRTTTTPTGSYNSAWVAAASTTPTATSKTQQGYNTSISGMGGATANQNAAAQRTKIEAAKKVTANVTTTAWGR